MDKINSVLTTLGVVIDWLVGLIQFIFSAFTTILATIGNAFMVIFNGRIFETLHEVVDYLGLYIGSDGAYMLMGLITLVFILLLVSFIMRFFKGEISYKLTLWKRDKLFKD